MKYSEDKDFFKISEGNIGLNTKNKIPMTPWALIEFRVPKLETTKGMTLDNIDGFLKELESGDSIGEEWVPVSTRKRSDREPLLGINKEIETKGTLAFDNFFEGIEIEDTGGLVKCELKLFDKDYGNLEDIIMKSILMTKLGSEQAIGDPETTGLAFSKGGKSSINFRIRFGYSDKPDGTGTKVIDDISPSGFEKRTLLGNKDKMTMKTNYLYFQMTNFKFVLTGAGLTASVSGMSVGKSFIDKYKLLKRFSVIEGTPKNILTDLGRELFHTSGGKICIVDSDGDIIHSDKDKTIYDSNSLLPPIVRDSIKDDEGNSIYKSEYGATWPVVTNGNPKGDYEIQVSYGSEPKVQFDKNNVVIPESSVKKQWMSIKSLLKSFCNKVPPAFYYEENGVIEQITDNATIGKIIESREAVINLGGKDRSRSSIKSVSYTYYVDEIIANDGDSAHIKIRFYYKFPSPEKTQKFLRKYNWRNNTGTLITGFAISSTQDFAMSSQSIAVFSEEGVKLQKTTAPEKATITNNESGTTIGANSSDLDKGDLLLCDFIIDGNESVRATGTAGDIAVSIMTQQIVNNMNDQSFKGTIEIPGDPFFMFTPSMQLQQYGIWISVKRDRNYYTDSVGSKLEESYLTGFYILGNIKHSLGKSGFKTTLSLSRWPTSSIELDK